MSIYLSRSFPISNSSFPYVVETPYMFLVDAGPGTPRICMQDEPTRVPINRTAKFKNKVGSLDVVASESLIKEQILERFFINLVAGESLIKERAAARFNDLVGSTHVVAGEPLFLLPRRFRQKQAWMELNKIWRTNTKVKGFIIEKVKGGYSVAIAVSLLFFHSVLSSVKGYQMIDSPLRVLTLKGRILWCSQSGRSKKNLMSEIC